jgi:signal transduction histidine kinase
MAHVDPAKLAVAQSLWERYPAVADAGVSQVISTGQPNLVPEVTDERLAARFTEPEFLELVRGWKVKSAMIVPMIARGRVLGGITFVTSESGARYDESDLAFAMDAAARAALAIENSRLYGDVQQAVRTRDEYLAAASHDLRNPLTAIRASAHLMRRRTEQLTGDEAAAVKSGLDIIESATVRMGRLINGLLDLARLEMGRPLELDRSRVDLSAIVRQVVLEAQQATRAERIRIVALEEVIGEWDAQRLERVVANLLDNALKYGGASGEVIVQVGRDRGGAQDVAVLEVTDHGVGIPREDLPHIFDRFHRGSNVVGQIGGTGLGLSGARQIVMEHGGTISVASEINQGTTVRVELPLSAPTQDSGRQPGAAPST